MRAVNPYLNFHGNAEEAFNFYKSVFGGEFAGVIRFKDMPGTEKLSAEEAEKLMHIALPIGKGNMLMATDALESMGHKITTGSNYYISLHAESEEEGKKLFDALSEGGKVDAPYQKQSWGDWHGNFADKFGIHWMVNYSENQQ